MKFFRNMKLYNKILSLVLLALVMLFSVGLVGYTYTNNMADSAENMYENGFYPLESLSTIASNTRSIRGNIFELMLITDEERNRHLNESITSRIEQNGQEMKELIAVFGEEDSELQHLQAQMQSIGEKERITIDLTLQNRNEEAYQYFAANVLDEQVAMLDTIDAMTQNVITYAEQINTTNEQEAKEAVFIVIVMIVAAAVLLLLLGIAIAKIISRPVKNMQELMGRAEKGDLTVEANYQAKDEVGQLAASFNVMMAGFKDAIGHINYAANSVSSAAQQISATTEEIASGSANQASSAQTMNELFKELSTAIQSVAESAEQAAELSNQTMGIARDGGIVVRSSIEGMNQVNDQMAKLEEDSSKIGEIIEVIDDIAEQTNLLALNAAIEAARAGDQGRGFAVVADEVRKLAERSSEATKQITNIIQTMQHNTKQSVKTVAEGVASSQQTGEAFKQIVTMVSDSAQKVSEIAAASEEQASQSSEVMASIESISSATEESAASSQETAATAQSLAQLAEELNASVSKFKIN